MSLTTKQQDRTSKELKANLQLSGLTGAQVAADLKFTPSRLQDTLDLTAGSHPVDVWQLRDYLDQAVRDAGLEPAPFSVLTEQSRALARMWFRLRPAPRHIAA